MTCTMNKRCLFILLPVATLVIGATLAAFYWNEARNEVVFLCGNFSNGVSQKSVLKQLDTGNFIQYDVHSKDSGSEIVSKSKINFGLYRCVIRLDGDGNVISAEIQ